MDILQDPFKRSVFIKNRPADAERFLISLGFDDGKVVFANTAFGAFPIVGDVFELGAGGKSAIGVTDFGVIDPAAYVADIFFHVLYSLV